MRAMLRRGLALRAARALLPLAGRAARPPAATLQLAAPCLLRARGLADLAGGPAAAAAQPPVLEAAKGEAAETQLSVTEEANQLVEEQKPEDPTRQFSRRILAAASVKNYDEVISLFDDMVNSNVTPNQTMLHLFLEAKAKLVGVAESAEAMRVVVAQHPNLEVGARAYSILMSECIERKDKDTAKSLFDGMLAEGISPNRDSFTVLMSVYVAAGDFESADGVFKDMRERGMAPLGATYLAYIFGCMSAGDGDRAFKMLSLMEAEWRFPSPRAYEQMLRFFGRIKHMEGQYRCIKAIIDEDNRHIDDVPNKSKREGDLHRQLTMSLSALMKDARSKGQHDMLLELERMAQHIGANLSSYQQTGVVLSMIKQGEPLQAFKRLVEILREKKLNPPPRMAQLVAQHLSHEPSLVDDAYFALEASKLQGLPVPIEAVNIVIEASALLNDLDRAFATWAELEQLDLKPNTGTYNSLLHACVRTREFSSARRLLRRMQQDEVPADVKTYVHRCSLLLLSKQIYSAIDLIGECSAAGLTPDPVMYVSCLNYMMRRKRFDEAKKLLADVEEKKVQIQEGYLEKIKAELQAAQ